MRFEPATRRPPHHPAAVARAARNVSVAATLPRDIAFLAPHVDRETLRAAAHRARHEGVSAARALIAQDVISDVFYYRVLADHLGFRFVDTMVSFAPDLDKLAALRRGHARLAPGEVGIWLIAPTDAAIDTLLRAHDRHDLSALRIAIATPNQFSRMLRNSARDTIAYAAQDGLPDRAPHLSARHASDLKAAFVASVGLGLCLAVASVCPSVVAVVIGLIFFAAMVFRLLVFANGVSPSQARDPVRTDAVLPVYTVLIPLYREAGMAEGLVASLTALDYPRSKLEILFLLEPRDHETEIALQRCDLPPGFRIVITPKGDIATKPRALNVGLMLAAGSLVTVFDAEDRPEPDQLRKAAARFAAVPDEVACLQARLAISNADDGLMQRLFALEYAALFDVYNIGLADWSLPMALGGTSNHFRAQALRAIGGWDAWNVTEDADLGLRLARFGYETQCLDSTTWETALDKPRAWMKQRRRWTKGWMQTLLVLVRDAGAMRALGPRRAVVVGLTLTSLVVAPLLTPFALTLIAIDLYRGGLPSPHDVVDLGESTLAASVVLLGGASTLWCGYVGACRRQMKGTFASLPWLLPYQLFIGAAAWMGFLDLILAPHHWHKTDHGEVTRARSLDEEAHPIGATAVQ